MERVAAWVAAHLAARTWSRRWRPWTELDRVGFDQPAGRAPRRRGRRGGPTPRCASRATPGDQLAARFAVFHLLGAAPDAGRGGRRCTGPDWAGLRRPRVLGCRRLRAPRARGHPSRRRPGHAGVPHAAAARGPRRGRERRADSGARFPWESAGDGSDVTPARSPGRHGELVPILTGEEQEHIVGDVAWAACRYAAWTGDTAFLEGRVAPCWSRPPAGGRAASGRDAGRAHIDAVMGPDEYHAVVDDNTYTNVLARWNLRRAAALVEATGGDATEARPVAHAGGRAGRRVRSRAGPARAVRRLLGSRAAAGDPDRPTAVRRRPAARCRARGRLAAHQAGRRRHGPPRPSRRDGARLAGRGPRVLRAPHRTRQLPVPRHLRRPARPRPGGPTTRSACSASPPGSTSTTSPGPPPAASTSPPSVASGRRSPTGSWAWTPRATTLGIDPCLPTPWQALELRFRFRGQPVAVRADHDQVHVTLPGTAARPPRRRTPVRRCDPPRTSIPIGGPR